MKKKVKIAIGVVVVLLIGLIIFCAWFLSESGSAEYYSQIDNTQLAGGRKDPLVLIARIAALCPRCYVEQADVEMFSSEDGRSLVKICFAGHKLPFVVRNFQHITLGRPMPYASCSSKTRSYFSTSISAEPPASKVMASASCRV